MMKAPRVTLKTEIPDTEAASGFPPTAYKFLPNFVLFQINQTIATAAIAHKIIIGKPPTLGIIFPGIDCSIPPKETPLVE